MTIDKITDYSPMMQRYLETKIQYKDCILLYRLGDFYEMFFDDAIEASKILDIALTGKSCGKDKERAPMCGIPHHAVDSYVAKLISAGKKIAICEQLEKPDESQNVILNRGVVRIITPGTAIETDVLQKNKNNYLMALYQKGEGIGLAFCDISTGEFEAYQSTDKLGKNLTEEVMLSVSPSEIICNSTATHLNTQFKSIQNHNLPKMTAYYDWTFDFNHAQEAIFKQFEVSSLKGFGLEKMPHATCACGAIIEYLNETQKRSLPHVKTIRILHAGEYMSIDSNARKNLELFSNTVDSAKHGSIFWLLDKTKTAMGGRKLSSWINRPLQNPIAIKQRLDAVEALYKDFILRETLIELLASVSDLERLTTKIVYKTAQPRDLLAIKHSLAQMPTIKKQLNTSNNSYLQNIMSEIYIFEDLVNLISQSINNNSDHIPTLKEGGFIKKGYNKQLDEFLDLKENSLRYLEELKQQEIVRTGIKSLKIGFNRIFGYYYEITNSFKNLTPTDYTRKQSLANAERYTNSALQSLEEKILTAQDSAIALEQQLYSDICNQVENNIHNIQKTCNAIALLDVLLSFAKVAIQNNYHKPVINIKDTSLKIKNGRHPIVEKFIKNNSFIPNDIDIDTSQKRTMILTGPNMAGKSTYMRQTALIVFLTHIGSFVPAEQAYVPITDKIFTRIGANDEISLNHSTFMVEMSEVSYILNNATEKSLIVLDEVGRGTATFDGLSIAWAIMEYITTKVKAKTLFATHYHELTELEGRLEGIINCKVAVKEIDGSIVFLHKILHGGASKSFGIEVAQLAGIPKEITDRAKRILYRLEKTDLNKNVFDATYTAEEETRDKLIKKYTEICNQLKTLDINTISPLIAFDILNNVSKELNEE